MRMRGSRTHSLELITSRVRSLEPSFAMMISFSNAPRSTARTRSTSSLIVCSSLYTGMMMDSFTARAAPESPPSSPADLTQLTGRVPCHDRPRRHTPGHDAAGAHDGVTANLDTAQNCRARTDRRAFTDNGPDHRPVAGPYQLAVRRHGTRVLVIDERH